MLEARKLYSVPHPDGTTTLLGGSRRFRTIFKDKEAIEERRVKEAINEAQHPFPDGTRTIIGWGGSSVAFRVEGTTNRYAVVLRSGEVYASGSEKRMNTALSPYTMNQEFVIAQGLNGEPALLKVNPEVNGSTMRELTIFGLMKNEDALRQYVDLGKKSLSYFLKQRLLVDTVGHYRQGLYMMMDIFGVVPFQSSNLMLDFETNKLVLIDCEPGRLMRTRVKFRPQILVRAAALAASVYLADDIVTLHSIRNRFFSQPTTQKEVQNRYPEYRQFLEGIADVVKTLEASGVNYRVLGSVAIAASIQANHQDYYLTPRRTNGSIRDIDVLVLDSQQGDIEALNLYFREKRKKNKSYPEVSIAKPLPSESVNDSDFDKGILRFTLTQVIRDAEGNIHLGFKDLRQRIPDKYLAPVVVNYDGVEFQTVSPHVLAGFAVSRGGSIRSKDIRKIALLLETYQTHIPSEFIDFARRLRVSYPAEFRNFQLKDFIGYISGEHFAIAKQVALFGKFIRSMNRLIQNLRHIKAETLEKI